MSFEFREEDHSYWLDGKRRPGVTSILDPLVDFTAVPPDVLRRAAEFGKAVHKTAELYLLDDLDEEGLDDNLRGPLAAFRLWEAERPEFKRPYLIETPDFHPRLKYAGTPDLSDESAVIDIKSRPVNMLTDPIQLAAYDHFGAGNRERYVLELKQDGSYVFTRVNKTKRSAEEAWSRFRYLLDLHNMHEQTKLWRGL